MSDLLNSPVDMPGNTYLYFLLVGDPVYAAGRTDYYTAPTWKHLADECLEFCNQEHICVHQLVETGYITRDYQGNRKYRFPDEVKIYIGQKLLQSLNGGTETENKSTEEPA